MQFAKVEAMENKALSQRLKVSQLPTLLWIAGGEQRGRVPSGLRSADTIATWLRSRSAPCDVIGDAKAYRAVLGGGGVRRAELA